MFTLGLMLLALGVTVLFFDMVTFYGTETVPSAEPVEASPGPVRVGMTRTGAVIACMAGIALLFAA